MAFGFGNPALNLTSLGMAGCTQYADHLAVMLFVPLGAIASNGMSLLIGNL